MQWILHASIGKTLNLIFILLKGFLGHKLIFSPLECILFCVRIENIKYILRKGPIYLASTVEVFPHFRVFILFMSTNFSVGFTTMSRVIPLVPIIILNNVCQPEIFSTSSAWSLCIMHTSFRFSARSNHGDISKVQLTNNRTPDPGNIHFTKVEFSLLILTMYLVWLLDA